MNIQLNDTVNKYTNNLIDNMPIEITKPIKIDLVLDGGMFNGSYLVGALYFIKEMERRKYIKIDRISGCSVGSIVGLLYYIDSLDIMHELYNIIQQEFKSTHTLSTIKSLKKYLHTRIPNNICSIINKKLYICYNDIINQKKIIKSTYTSIDDILDTIIKSCYVPLLIDTKLLYKHKYIDGINAYIFNRVKHKKILHMELLSYDKFINSVNIKNENTNIHRILYGLLDIYTFFIKKSSTHMCSYVENWSIINNINYKIKLLVEQLIIKIILFIIYLKKYTSKKLHNSLIIKMFLKIISSIFSVILDNYFI